MKLAATLCALSFAIVGCVDENSTNGGGQLGGMQSPKGASDDVGQYENPYAWIAQPDHEIASKSIKASIVTLGDIWDLGVEVPRFANCKTGPCNVQYATVEHFGLVDDIVFFANDAPVCHLVRQEGTTVFTDCTF